MLAVWAIGSVLLMSTYYVFASRHLRLRAAREGRSWPSGAAANPLALMRAAFGQGPSFRRRTGDQELDSARRKALISFLACLGWVFGFGLLSNLASWIEPSLPRIALLQVRLPELSLPRLAASDGDSAQRWATLVFVAGYVVVMGWGLVSAVRGGPDWQSGHPGDAFRFSRRSVIAITVTGLVLAPILLLASLWFLPG